MADMNQIIGAAKAKAAEAGEKIKNIDTAAIKDEVRNLDTGVLYTKALDAIAKLDIPGKKQAVIDFIDSPTTAALKEKAYLLKDFLGYVPQYAQSVPTMIKEGFEKLTKK